MPFFCSLLSYFSLSFFFQFKFGNWYLFLDQLIVQSSKSEDKGIADRSPKSSSLATPDLLKSNSDFSTHSAGYNQNLSFTKMNSNYVHKMVKQDSNKSMISVSTPINRNQENTQVSAEQSQKQKTLHQQLQRIQKMTNYYFIKLIEVDQDTKIFVLQPSFKKHILEQAALSKDQKRHFQIQHIKYMSILSRQLLRSIKQQKVQEFDPYLVSSQIDDGIWSEPLSLELNFQDSNENERYSKMHSIDNASQYFINHEVNFVKFFEINEIRKLVKLISESIEIDRTKSEVISHLDEILVNVPSIFIILNRQQEAEKLIDGIQDISNIKQLSLTSAKLMLIQASIHLSLNCSKISDVVESNLRKAHQIFTEQPISTVFTEKNSISAQGETMYLEVIREIKKIVQKQLAQNSRAQKLQQRFNYLSKTVYEKAQDDFTVDNPDHLYIIKEERDLDSSPDAKQQHSPAISFDTQNQNSQKFKISLDQVVQVIAQLQKCREQFDKSDAEFCLARTWILQADLIFGKLDQNSILQQKVIDQMQISEPNFLENLFKQIEEATSEVVTIENIELVSTRCLQYMAQIRFYQENFVSSNKLILECLKRSQLFGLQVIQKDAKKIANKISDKLQTGTPNIFLFAKSCPINADSDYADLQNQVLYHGIQDDSDQLIKTFESKVKSTQKQLSIKIDILNEQFFKNLSKKGCRLLHISPYLLSIQNQQCASQMLIEDENFQKQILTPESLRQLLQPTPGKKLKTHLVIIDMPNCHKFTKVFEDLGVPHVISFKTSWQYKKQKIQRDDQKQLDQSKLNIFMAFAKQFAKNLYPLISENKPIKESIKRARSQIYENYDRFEELEIDVLYTFKNRGYKYNTLFDQELSKTSATTTESNEVCDISQIRCNIDFTLDPKPFILRKSQPFAQLTNLITFQGQREELLHKDLHKSLRQKLRPLSTTKIVNVFGQRGVGKTRLVMQVADYLRFRYRFGAGVHYQDLSKTKNIETLTQVFRKNLPDKEDLETKKLDSKQSKKLRRKSISNEDMQIKFKDKDLKPEAKDDHLQQVLFIFDNCDEFIRKNRVSLQANLKYIQKQFSQISVIMISKEMVYQDDKNISRIHIEPFRSCTSKIFFQTMIQGVERIEQKFKSDWGKAVSEATQLIQKANGNAQILSIISVIFQLGGSDLLSRVNIQSIDNLPDYEKKTRVDIDSSQDSCSQRDDELDQNIVQDYLDLQNQRKMNKESQLKQAFQNLTVRSSQYTVSPCSRYQQGKPKPTFGAYSRQAVKSKLKVLNRIKSRSYQESSPDEDTRPNIQISDLNNSGSQTHRIEENDIENSQTSIVQRSKTLGGMRWLTQQEKIPLSLLDEDEPSSTNLQDNESIKNKKPHDIQMQNEQDLASKCSKSNYLMPPIKNKNKSTTNVDDTTENPAERVQAQKKIENFEQITKQDALKIPLNEINQQEQSPVKPSPSSTDQASPVTNLDTVPLTYNITNQSQYSTKYKNIVLEATNVQGKKLKIVIDTEKQIMLVYGPKPSTNEGQSQDLKLERQFTASDATPKVGRVSTIIGYSIGETQEQLVMMPEKEWYQIKEINMFIPISEQLLNQTEAIQSFQRSLTLKQKSDNDSFVSGEWKQDDDEDDEEMEQDQLSCHSHSSNISSDDSDSHDIYGNKDKKQKVTQAKKPINIKN